MMQTTPKATSFVDLPSEMAAHVFLFLPSKVVGRTECVCVQWSDLLKSHKPLQQPKLKGMLSPHLPFFKIFLFLTSSLHTFVPNPPYTIYLFVLFVIQDA